MRLDEVKSSDSLVDCRIALDAQLHDLCARLCGSNDCGDGACTSSGFVCKVLNV